MSDQTPQVQPVVRQIGVSEDGSPLFAYRDPAPIVQPQPAAARPYGAYIGVGIVGVAGVTALGFVAAVLAVALSIGAVSLTICVVILRSVWQDYQRQARK